MHWLMWFTIGFTAACAAGVYLQTGLLPLVFIAIAVPLFFLRSRTAKCAAIALIGLVVGTVWLYGYDALYLNSARDYDGQTVSATAVVADYSFDTQFGIAADTDMELDGKQFRVRMYLSGEHSLSPGDRVTGDLRFRLTTSDSMQGSTYHQGDGIFLLAYAYEQLEIHPAASVPAKYYPAVLRRQITDRIDRAFAQDTVAFARALLLGDSSLLSYEEDTAFKISGIRHIIAVSGLHVSIVMSFVYLFAGRRRVLSAVLGIPMLFLFAAVAGFTPSVVRACIMQALVLLALLFDKEYDPPTALSFAVFTMLCVNPQTITSVSFQLSAGCLVGIFLFYQRIYQYLCVKLHADKGKTKLKRILRWICSSVAISLSAMAATTPLSAWYFGTVSLTGILTNVLTLWVVSFIFYGIVAVCILGIFWPVGASVLGWIVSWPIRYVQFMARLLSGFTYSAVYTCSIYVVLWLILFYVLLAAFLWMKEKRPVVFTGCALAGLVIALLCSYLEPRVDDVRVTVLDVGQGQSVLLQSEGRNYLVDCGGDNGKMAADKVAALLLSQGVTRLNGLILTHYDTDHAGGVEPLLTRIGAEKLYLPDIADDNHIREFLENSFSEQIVWVREDTVLSGKSMKLSLFPGDLYATGNESCQSVLFQTKNCDILITSDLSTKGEQNLMDRIDLPKLELLVAGHHGAASSTGFPLLDMTTPETVVFSVGKNNYHGHPSEEVLFRLRLFGCRIRRTDLDGNLIFKG